MFSYEREAKMGGETSRRNGSCCLRFAFACRRRLKPKSECIFTAVETLREKFQPRRRFSFNLWKEFAPVTKECMKSSIPQESSIIASLAPYYCSYSNCNSTRKAGGRAEEKCYYVQLENYFPKRSCDVMYRRAYRVSTT